MARVIDSPDDASLDERRRSERLNVGTAATVLGSSAGQVFYWAKNISAEGALLRGKLCDAGTQLVVLLHMPWFRPIFVAATVRHSRVESVTEQLIGVEFEHADADSRDLLARALSLAEERSVRQQPAVLVLSEDAGLARRLVAQFGALGHVAFHVRTPVEAVTYLQDPSMRVEATLVDLGMRGSEALGFLAFLQEEFPDVRRVLVSMTAVPQRLR
jgi:hypothetical protein